MRAALQNDRARARPRATPPPASRDKRFFKALGDSSKLSEVMYPQLQGVSAMTNIPSLFKMLFKVASVFMSKRTLEKVQVCKGVTNSPKASLSKCPFAGKRIDASAVPAFLGGTAACPASLLPGGVRPETGEETEKETGAEVAQETGEGSGAVKAEGVRVDL